MKQALFILCLTASPVMAASNPLSCELEPNSKPCAVEDWRASDADGYIERGDNHVRPRLYYLTGV